MHANDNQTPLAHLKAAMDDFARERDWHQFHTPKNLSMAIAAEAGELMEHFLWSESQDSVRTLSDPQKKAKVADELADIFLFALQFANVTGIDVASVIMRKLEKNANKYPVSKAKGRSEKYTEL